MTDDYADRNKLALARKKIMKKLEEHQDQIEKKEGNYLEILKDGETKLRTILQSNADLTDYHGRQFLIWVKTNLLEVLFYQTELPKENDEIKNLVNEIVDYAKASPDHMQPFVLPVFLYSSGLSFHVEKYSEALTDLNHVLPYIAPENYQLSIEVLFARALTCIALKERAAAIGNFDAIIDICIDRKIQNYDYTRALVNRGVLSFDLKETTRAQVDIEAGIAIIEKRMPEEKSDDEQHALSVALEYLSKIYITQDKFHEAEEAAKKAIDAFPAGENGYQQLGSIYLDQKKYATAYVAISCAKMAVANKPSNKEDVLKDIAELETKCGKEMSFEDLAAALNLMTGDHQEDLLAKRYQELSQAQR